MKLLNLKLTERQIGVLYSSSYEYALTLADSETVISARLHKNIFSVLDSVSNQISKQTYKKNKKDKK